MISLYPPLSQTTGTVLFYYGPLIFWIQPAAYTPTPEFNRLKQKSVESGVKTLPKNAGGLIWVEFMGGALSNTQKIFVIKYVSGHFCQNINRKRFVKERDHPEIL